MFILTYCASKYTDAHLNTKLLFTDSHSAIAVIHSKRDTCPKQGTITHVHVQVQTKHS